MKNNRWISRVQEWAGAAAGGRDLAAWIAIGLLVLGTSVVFNSFGLLHFELSRYITYHLGPGPVWEKIFDNRALDPGTYEGRELSYLFDHFDVLMVALSVKLGWPMFISATHVVLCVFIGVWVAWFAARDLGLGSLVGLLLALLFWTTPFVYLHFLLRSGKVLTAAAVAVLLVEICRALRRRGDEKPDGLPTRFVLSIMVSAGVLSFSDRQGFYFLAGTCLLVAVQWVWHRAAPTGRVGLLLAGVLALELSYFFWIAPALAKAFFGYTTDLSFNQLPLEELFAHRAYFAGEARALLADIFGYTLGRIPPWAVALVLAAILGLALARDRRLGTWRSRLPLAGIIVAGVAALWVMYALMILRHPAVLWPDTRLVYYWIPTGALVVLGVASVVGGWVGQNPGRKAACAVLLWAVVLRNVAALPDHRRVLADGHLAGCAAATLEIRDALRHRGDPGYVVPPEIERIPGYRALLEFAPGP